MKIGRSEKGKKELEGMVKDGEELELNDSIKELMDLLKSKVIKMKVMKKLKIGKSKEERIGKNVRKENKEILGEDIVRVKSEREVGKLKDKIGENGRWIKGMDNVLNGDWKKKVKIGGEELVGDDRIVEIVKGGWNEGIEIRIGGKKKVEVKEIREIERKWGIRKGEDIVEVERNKIGNEM